MVGSSKILTVSYGTFSCTLEGFDQPFETMKSIAEYFRDLAADDRYFGAEPPQPDAQMLHQIAEREVRRRVETRVESNGVVLRQTAEAMPPRDAATSGTSTRHGASQGDDRCPSETSPQSNAPFDVDIDGDSVAAKLSRIRAVVARARATREADIAYAEDEPVEDYLSHAPSDGFEDTAGSEDETDDFETETVSDDDSEPDTTAASIMDALNASDDEAEASAQAEEQACAEAEAAEQAEAEARAQAEEQARAEAEAAEQAEAEARAQAEEQARAEAEAAEQAEAEARAQAEEQARAEAEAAEQAEAEARAQAEEQARAEAEAAEQAEQVEAERVAPTRVMPQRPHARVIKLKRTEFEAALAAGEIEEVEDDDEDDDTIAEIDVEDDEALAPETAEGALDTIGAADTLAAILTADVAQSRTDQDALADFSDDDTFTTDEDDHDNLFDPSDADDQRAEDDDEALTAGIRNLIGETSLDDSDEEELAAELADVERDASAASRETEQLRQRFSDMVEDDAEDTVAAAAPGDAEDPADQDERALSRLLDETNAKMSDSEGTRRRSAIAHLKAAVAATRADIKARGGRPDPEKDDSLSRYRDDLQKVVRPRRPGVAAADGDASPRVRPASDAISDRPAPLMLVSELRVDRQDAPTRPAGPVRPRRVARKPQGDDPSRAQDKQRISFRDFVAARGATDLDDVLEAAALYTAEVEGQETMSRPQLLRRAASLDPKRDIGREQGLKSFGALLRSGRIRKLGKGQFGLAATSDDDAEQGQPHRYVGE
ncbi:hypothetical protein [Oceaniglobus indicus]|uniref:hypothetical protein n=1 Tax=Oceaniglobus indicus TaxID=2047749 RepID=UPI0011AB5DF7|nr:hypothetical protein [Oceaniglobus indicus]